MNDTTQTDQNSQQATLQENQGQKAVINLEDQVLERTTTELEMVDDKVPEDEDIRSPVNYRGNYEEIEKTEEIEIEDKGTRKINQYTTFKTHNRSQESNLSSQSKGETLYLLKKENGEWKVTDLSDLRKVDYNAKNDEYHDLKETGIRKKVNWTKRSHNGRGESGSGCSYMIQREAIRDVEEAKLLKRTIETGGNINGADYRNEGLEIYNLELKGGEK